MRCKFTRQSLHQVVHCPSFLRNVRRGQLEAEHVGREAAHLIDLSRYLPFSADKICSAHGAAPICKISVEVAAKISGLSSGVTKIAAAGSGSVRRSIRLPSFALNTRDLGAGLLVGPLAALMHQCVKKPVR